MRHPLYTLSLILALLLAACGGNNGDGGTTPDETGESPSAGETVGAAPSPAEGGGETATVGTDAATVGATAGATASAPASGETASPAAGATGTSAVGAGGDATGTVGPTRPVKVSVFYNGTLGDKGFFDSAQAGVQRAQKELGVQIVREVAEPSPANWTPTLERLAAGEAEVIVLGTFQTLDALAEVAPKHPDKKFILFDATTVEPIPNVASILYAQNEGSFLAGVVAACAAASDLEGVTGEKVIGAVGGQDIPVINDFIVGYEQGAKYFDSDFEVRKVYNAGPTAFEDPAKGKTLANSLFDDGASVVFNVAGKTGLGVLEAAKEQGRYAIGVDSNQNGIPAYKGAVLTSMLKRVDNSVFDLLQMEATGGLQTGKTYPYGIQNEGVGLAEDAIYEDLVPADCQERVEQAKADIASGKVEVETAFK